MHAKSLQSCLTASLVFPALAGGLFTTSATREANTTESKRKKKESSYFLARTGPAKSHWMIASQFHFPLCRRVLFPFLCKALRLVHHGCILNCNLCWSWINLSLLEKYLFLSSQPSSSGKVMSFEGNTGIINPWVLWNATGMIIRANKN